MKPPSQHAAAEIGIKIAEVQETQPTSDKGPVGVTNWIPWYETRMSRSAWPATSTRCHVERSSTWIQHLDRFRLSYLPVSPVQGQTEWWQPQPSMVFHKPISLHKELMSGIIPPPEFLMMASPAKSFSKDDGSFDPPYRKNLSLMALPALRDNGSSWHISCQIVVAKHRA